MQIISFLHRFLKRKLPSMHKLRRESLLAAIRSLIGCRRLSLTGLGRGLGGTSANSNIKRMDRLLGNEHLNRERIDFYRLFADLLIVPGSRPNIIVDWSCIHAKTRLYMLRAALCMRGRSITIYEECHPQKNENNHAIHKAFLARLKSLIPANVRPIIITDAGFRSPWFQEIISMILPRLSGLANSKFRFYAHSISYGVL